MKFKMNLQKNKTTKQEIGARLIHENGVETYANEYLVYFLIQPDNIAVLSESMVRTKILHLSAMLKGVDGLEFVCINSRENFDHNKNFYKQRLMEEKSEKVRGLLQKDLAHLDRVQIQMASAREFLFVLRFKNYNPDSDDVHAGISRMEKILKDEGFIARRADKEDIKRIFSVYFVQNLTQVYFDDYDGEQWVKGDSLV